MLKSSSWPWLLLSPALWAAQVDDPFQPPLQVPCRNELASPAHWRLKGTIGLPAMRYGWVLTPEGQWLRLEAKQTLLAGHWRVDQVTPGQVELTEIVTDSVCPAGIGRITLVLGNHKEAK